MHGGVRNCRGVIHTNSIKKCGHRSAPQSTPWGMKPGRPFPGDLDLGCYTGAILHILTCIQRCMNACMHASLHPIHPQNHQSIRPFIHPSIHPSIYLYIYPSISTKMGKVLQYTVSTFTELNIISPPPPPATLLPTSLRSLISQGCLVSLP